MLRKFLLTITGFALILLSLPFSPTHAQSGKLKIAFVPGRIDPFYQTMQKGIEQAAADLGVEVVTQVPQTWDAAVQTPIIAALAADKSINAVIAVPVDKDQMLSPLQALDNAGIPVITA